MKKRLIELLHGFLFGMSCLIPGFSGGTMLLILGIYESFTASVAKFSKNPLESIRELIFYGIGAVIGVVLATLTVVVCLNKFPLITASFFVGLVIATLPIVIRNIKGKKITKGSIISFILFLVIALGMAFGDLIGLPSINLSTPNVWMIIYILVLATVASATMIVPAASGMTVLLVFGLYDSILTVLSDIFKGLVNLDFSPIIDNLWILIPFVIGVIIGVIGIAKIISKLLKTRANLVWYAILSLLIASPITIYRDAYMKRITPMLDSFMENIKINIIFSLIALIVGFAILTYLDFIQKKNSQNQELEEQVIEEEVA